jgi:YggT family protein
MYALLDILALAVQGINMLLIAWFILGLLFSFNVINHQNQFLVSVYRSIAALFEPLLRPIRRVLPDTGAIDFSPMVLMFVLWAVLRILQGIVLGA